MRYLNLLLIILLLAGCSVISKEMRREVDRSITLPMVQADPDAFKDKKVLWGGIIISSKNLADKTVIEVLQTPLDITDKVTDKEKSQGRFLIESSTYVDTYLYKEGKNITVAGIIKGVTTQKIGEKDYTYPVLEPLEMHGYEFEQYPRYEPYFGPYYMPFPPSTWPDRY